MSKRWASLFLLRFGVVLSLAVPIQAQADFIIKFTDSSQVIVHRYTEEDQIIKIYTPYGTISFRKDEVSSITEINASHSMSVPLETVSAVSAPSIKVSAPGPSESQNTTNSDKTPRPEGGDTTGTASASTTTLEKLDGEYQEVKQEFDRLWEKHVQDMNSGASEEVLTENRSKLTQLSNEQHELVNDARRVAPDNLPTWAQ
jgi:hypothetical protein